MTDAKLTAETLDDLSEEAEDNPLVEVGSVTLSLLIAAARASLESRGEVAQPAESPWVAALEFESRAAVVTRSEMVSCSRGSLAWINAAETLSDHVEELGRILASKEPTNGR